MRDAPPLPPEATATSTLTPDEARTVQLFRENTASVVYVTNLRVDRDAFTLDELRVPQGTGSGFVWDNRGYIVTNLHVVRGANDLAVTFADQRVFRARVVGFDVDKDIAVLRIDADDAEPLRPVVFGRSASLQVGQRVYAIGNPFGLDHTLTTGASADRPCWEGAAAAAAAHARRRCRRRGERPRARDAERYQRATD